MSTRPELNDSLLSTVTETKVEPARPAILADIPDWVPHKVRDYLPAQLYSHQEAALNAHFRGEHVFVTTGTNSGKSLCLFVPAVMACLNEPLASALFLVPNKALAQDQAGRLSELAAPLNLKVATYDGDTPKSQRAAIRGIGNLIVTNPDMLHVGILPSHASWSRVLKSLRVVALDEAHVYRGVFGSHTALILRRLLRLCAQYHNFPRIVAASATVANPAQLFKTLTGQEATVIETSGAPTGNRTYHFMQSPTLPSGEVLPASVTCSEVMASLVSAGAQCLAFSRSQIGAELLLKQTRLRLDPTEALKVDSYRAGYTPAERRGLEKRLKSGALRGLSATSAMELGIDVGQLDAVVLNGYPGTPSSFWQQMGRAGRGVRDALGIYVASEDALDQYLVANPQTLLYRRAENVVLRPENPNILQAQLRCAAYERPIAPTELEAIDPNALDTAEQMDRSGELVFQSGHFYYPAASAPAAGVNIRGAIGTQIQLICDGKELGEMEYPRALRQAHTGAIYLHRGESYLVDELNLEAGVAILRKFDADYFTVSQQQTMLEPGPNIFSKARFGLCAVTVTETVIGFSQKKIVGGEILDTHILESPPETFETVALRIDLPPLDLEAELEEQICAIHAAEHGLLALAPYFAGCDRGDLGSVWYAHFYETGNPALFIYDRTPGGMGFCEMLLNRLEEWLPATIQIVTTCKCENGCPSCILLPQCEVGNTKLSKTGAIAVLKQLLYH